jgi:phosphonate transport system substrate-binding protein
MLGLCHCLEAAAPPAAGGEASTGANDVAPVRLAMSESLVSGANMNDARAAMVTWIRQIELDTHIQIEMDPKVFEPSVEIFRRARSGLFDAVALNVIEYRQIADVLDSSQIICETEGFQRYMLPVKRGGAIQTLGDVRGRRLLMLAGPKMCVASHWLSTILDAGHFVQTDQFFSSVAEEVKAARVVLPVFFGKADACVAAESSFDVLCELNPQVAKELTAIAISPTLVSGFYLFRKNYTSANRDRFAHVYSSVSGSVAGRQLSTLFQFNSLTVRDATCLESALAVLDKAERIRTRTGPAGQGGQ